MIRHVLQRVLFGCYCRWETLCQIKNTWLKWVSRRKGDSTHLANFSSFFSKFYFYDQLSPRLTKRDDYCFLGVCVCLRFVAILLLGIPRLLFSPWEITVCGGGKGERESWRESLSRLDLAGEAFLSSAQPSLTEHKSQGSSSQRQLSLIQRDFTAALVQNFVSYRNSPKQWQSLFVRFLFPSPSYYPLLCCVVT